MPKELPKGMTIQVRHGYLCFACDGQEVAIGLEAFSQPMTLADFNIKHVTPSALALTYALVDLGR